MTQFSENNLNCGGCGGLGMSPEAKSKELPTIPLIETTVKLTSTGHFGEILKKFNLMDRIAQLSDKDHGVALERNPDGSFSAEGHEGAVKLVLGSYILHTRKLDQVDPETKKIIKGTSEFVGFKSLDRAALAFGEWLVRKEGDNVLYTNDKGLSCPMQYMSRQDYACVVRADLKPAELEIILYEAGSLQRMRTKAERDAEASNQPQAV